MIISKRFSILSLLLVLVAACTSQPEATQAPEPTEGSVEQGLTEETTNAVSVEDQDLGPGNTVTVASVTTDIAGWLVIHAQADSAPGPILGYAPVNAGENSNVVVEIDPAGATENLYAMLHVDAGTVGEYEFPGDDVPAKDTEDNVVTPLFSLTIPNSVAVEDQVLGAGNTVVIVGVTSADSGWIVIHIADEEGKPGSIIGYTPVAAGNNSDVLVEIEAELATETLFAMLHVDAGTVGEYEFPGDDAPVMDTDGNVVVLPFILTQ